jgi:cytoplasmic iron level regulating protein YaaA (DUF328/UPF0246 family)
MVSAPTGGRKQTPIFRVQAVQLDGLLKGKSAGELQKLMHVSAKLAETTRDLIADWSVEPKRQTLAIDAFQGDIYRGLQAQTISEPGREWANDHLRILSGLYGILRPFDRIMPYRLELYYRLQGDGFSNLYDFWGDQVAASLPKRGPIFDLASEEYARLVTPFVPERRVIEPNFLTRATPADEPTFVAVHAKEARGTMARWMIENRIETESGIHEFTDMGYGFDPERSESSKPVFVRTGPWRMGARGLPADDSD